MPGEEGSLSSPLLHEDAAHNHKNGRDILYSSLDLRVQQELARTAARKSGQVLKQQEELARSISREAGKLLDSQEREARNAASKAGVTA